MRFTCLCCDLVKLASNRRGLNSISDRYLFVFDIAAVMIIQRTRFSIQIERDSIATPFAQLWDERKIVIACFRT